MKTEQLLAIAIVAGVGILLMSRFRKKTENSNNQENDYQDAKGDVQCICQGYPLGMMSEAKCRRLCSKAININIQPK